MYEITELQKVYSAKTSKRSLRAMDNPVKECATSNQSLGMVPGKVTGPPVAGGK